jgi:hypothetical protein
MTRYTCDIPGFEDCFIEFTDAWSRREIRKFYGTTDTDDEKEKWLSLIRHKIDVLHIKLMTGLTIDTPSQLTEEALDEMDIRLFHWMNAAIQKAPVDVSELGNAARRRLWDTSEISTDTTDRQKS